MNDKKIMNTRYVSVKEISEYTSIADKTLYEWASQEKIPSIKIGSRVLFDLNDIDQLMASLKRPYNRGKDTVNKIVEEAIGNDI